MNNSDYVSRGEVTESVYQALCEPSDSDAWRRIGRAIRETEAADVRENVNGKWVHRHYIIEGGNTIDTVYCIECGEEYSYDAETGVSAEDYNFCPNCGANNRPKTTSTDMIGEEQ